MFLISLARADALLDYAAAVKSATQAVATAALPRIAACKRPAAALVITVDLAARKAQSAVLGAEGASRVSNRCIEGAVLAALTPRPAAGAQAVLVLTAAGALDGDVALYGSMETDAIEAGVRPGMMAVGACYAAGLEQTPGLAGELVVSFTVLPDGRAHGPEARRSTLSSPDTVQCVVAQVSGMQFTPPSNGAIARVSYPFTFRPPE